MHKKILLFLITIIFFKNAFTQHKSNEPVNRRYDHAVGFDERIFSDYQDFSDYQFDSSVSFGSSTFKGPFLMSGSTINSWSNFDSITFKSWADFDSTIFEKVPSQYLTNFEFTQFEDSAFFYKATLNNPFFKKTHFHKWATFQEANIDSAYFVRSIFDSSASFSNAKIKDYANFDSTQFNWLNFENVNVGANMNFVNAVFNSDAYFDSVTVRGWSNFSGSRFKSICNFSNIKFGRSKKFIATSFSNLRFDSTAWFMGSVFNDTLDFSYDTVYNTLYFDSSRLGVKSYFTNLSFKGTGKLSFLKTILSDTLDFSYNYNIPVLINLSEANFSDTAFLKKGKYNRHKINLYKTDISKFQLDYLHFKLYFDPAQNVSDEDKETVYEALLSNFKNKGEQESAKKLDIEYRTFKWNHSWASFLPCVPYYWNHFGYDKQMIFQWTFLFVIMFTIITYIMIEYLNTKVYSVEGIPSSFENVGSRLWYSFVYTSSVFFRLTLKIEKINFERKLGTAYLIFIYTIGLICLAYMANFVLQK